MMQTHPFRLLMVLSMIAIGVSGCASAPVNYYTLVPSNSRAAMTTTTSRPTATPSASPTPQVGPTTPTLSVSQASAVNASAPRRPRPHVP